MKKVIATVALAAALGLATNGYAEPRAEVQADSAMNTARSQMIALENDFGATWKYTAPANRIDYAETCVDRAIKPVSGRAKGAHIYERPHFKKALDNLEVWKEQLEQAKTK